MLLWYTSPPAPMVATIAVRELPLRLSLRSLVEIGVMDGWMQSRHSVSTCVFLGAV
jgi:hypothetical protein